ncbi:hypothetical protein L1987_30931 [Smallanthus sonchifolius]|uniref:Uncharacterized protein n=1 Tax=Smallanthus sonchifolius TaxID=185202 RepID=A0ACB9I5D0_9ASTR|nr:hypothetical protein L1987_30931 [Smallanthus sonchifolius]
MDGLGLSIRISPKIPKFNSHFFLWITVAGHLILFSISLFNAALIYFLKLLFRTSINDHNSGSGRTLHRRSLTSLFLPVS